MTAPPAALLSQLQPKFLSLLVMDIHAIMIAEDTVGVIEYTSQCQHGQKSCLVSYVGNLECCFKLKYGSVRNL